MIVSRVTVTEEAKKIIAELRKSHGELMFHQSGGCCDGSAPMCFPLGEMHVGDSDVLLGYIDGCPFYMASDQFEYWKHTHLTIDITKGRGSSFSIEIPLGVRFMVKSRIFTETEIKNLSEINPLLKK